MSDLAPTHYRGSLAIYAENELKHRGCDLKHGTRTTEGRRDGQIIHRCEDIKTGMWIEVSPSGSHAYVVSESLS